MTCFNRPKIIQNPNVSKLFEIKDNHHDKLTSRKKGAALDINQKLHLSKLYSEYPEEHERINRVYKISKSTYYRIMKLKFYPEEKEDKLIHGRSKNQLSLAEKQKIKELVMPPKAPITISKIQINLFNQFGQKPAACELKRFLKEELKF